MVNAYLMWILNDAQVKIEGILTLLGGHREVLVDTGKDVLEEVGFGLGTQEIICGSSNYYNALGVFY